MNNRCWILALCALVIGCAQQGAPLSAIQTTAPIAVPDILPLKLNTVQWQVMTLPQLKSLVVQLQQSKNQAILFSLDTTGYNNLSLNLIELERYIKEQKAIIAMLQKIIAERSAAANSPQ